MKTGYLNAPNLIRKFALFYDSHSRLNLVNSLFITSIIAVPVWLIFIFSTSQNAIAYGIGAILLSLNNVPGSFSKRRNTFLVAIVALNLICLVTAYLNNSFILLGLWICICSFCCSCTSLLDKRIYTLGISAMVMMIFVIGLAPLAVFPFVYFVFFGTLVSAVLSVVYDLIYQRNFYPFSKILYAESDMAFVRADFYDPSISISVCMQRALKNQSKIQAVLRDMDEQLREKKISGSSVSADQEREILGYIRDFNELLRSRPLDYQMIRSELTSCELQIIREQIFSIALQLRRTASSFHIKEISASDIKECILEGLANLNALADVFTGRKRSALISVIQNIKALQDLLKVMSSCINTSLIPLAVSWSGNTGRPISTRSQVMKVLVVISKFCRKDLIFPVKQTLAMILAYLIATMFKADGFAYWIMLTVAVVLRPGFQASRQRGIARVKGTLAGLLLSLMVLYLSSFTIGIIAILSGIFFFFYFLNSRYSFSVCFITLSVIVGLYQLNSNYAYIYDRLVYTLIGCSLCFILSRFRPEGECGKITECIRRVVSENLYFIKSTLSEEPLKENDFDRHISLLMEQLKLCASSVTGARLLGRLDKIITLNATLYETLVGFKQARHFIMGNKLSPKGKLMLSGTLDLLEYADKILTKELPIELPYPRTLKLKGQVTCTDCIEALRLEYIWMLAEELLSEIVQVRKSTHA